MSNENNQGGQQNNSGQSQQDTQANQGADQGTGDVPQVSELELLKSRAKMLGITFSNNIGVDALKEKIANKMEGRPDPIEMPKTDSLDDENSETVDNPSDGATVNALEFGANNGQVLDRPKALHEWIHDEQMKLVRVRITNLDPKKKDLPGEILTVANEYLGTVRKFVPYGEATEDGYHLPFCLYEMLRTKKFLNIRTVRDRRTGTQTVQQTWAPEFSLEVLEPLTRQELATLAQAQIAAGSLDAQAA